MAKQALLTVKLINTLIADATIKPGPAHIYNDSRVPALCVRKTKAGATLDFKNIKRKPGEPASRKLANWPCDLEKIRAEARRLEEQGIEAATPAPRVVAVKKSADVLESMFEGYFNSTKFQKLKRARDIEGTIRRDFLSVFGKRKPETVTRHELQTWLDSFTPAKAALARGCTYGGINYLEKIGKLAPGAFPRVRPEESYSAEIKELPGEEYRALWRASLRVNDKLTGAKVRALMLSGLRSDSILGARWDEIEFAGEAGNEKIWLNVPATRSKHNKPYSAAISRELVKLFLEMGLPQSESEYIFKADESASNIINSNFKKKIRKIMTEELGREPAQFRFHDLRKNFRTYLSQLGVNAFAAEIMLGHMAPSVTSVHRTYDMYEYASERAEAIKKVTAHILALCEGHQETFKRLTVEEPRKADAAKLKQLAALVA